MLIFCRTVFVCPHSPYRDNDMIFWLALSRVLHVALATPQSQFIWGRYHVHSVDDLSSSRFHYYLMLLFRVCMGGGGYKCQLKFSPFVSCQLNLICQLSVNWLLISNSNWTEWSTIQGVIERVISKSDEREARGRFEITSTITPWIVRHEVQLLINRIYNKFRN